MTTYDNLNRSVTCLALLMVSIISASAQAAPKESGSAKMVAKLQTMVKEITTERDTLKTENAKLQAEIDTLKGDVQKEKDTALQLEEKLNADLAAQKTSNEETHSRLDNAMAKLHEVVDKYNALNKSKNELAAEHAGLQNTQQQVSSELKACESKNIKMYEGAKEVIKGYESCQNRGIVDTLIGSEPLLQIKNVEFETIVQEYEDKLNKQKYQIQPGVAAIGASEKNAVKANGASVK